MSPNRDANGEDRLGPREAAEAHAHRPKHEQLAKQVAHQDIEACQEADDIIASAPCALVKLLVLGSSAKKFAISFVRDVRLEPPPPRED